MFHYDSITQRMVLLPVEKVKDALRMSCIDARGFLDEMRAHEVQMKHTQRAEQKAYDADDTQYLKMRL